MKNFYKIFGSFKFSFIPPLMIYLAAGVSGITIIVGLFFVKEYLDQLKILSVIVENTKG